MTMISSDIGAPHRHYPGIARGVRRRIARARQEHRERRMMAELSQLPAHVLKDIGLEDYAQPREPTDPRAWR